MKKGIVFAVIFMAISLVAQAANKNDFTFSLSGGSIHGKFTLASDFLYAGEFGRFFVQAAGFANLGQTKEYGGSFGLGLLTDEGGDVYVFADTLYSYGKFWTQIRPTARLRFSWLSLTAFYALPITKSTVQVDGQEVGAAKYWGGELTLVPIPWGRFYGNLLSVGRIYTYRFGAEIRPIRWVSISAEWNKVNADIYSKWNNGDFRAAVNLLLGGQQQSFSPKTRVQVTPQYPILAKKVNSVPDPWLTGGEIEILLETPATDLRDFAGTAVSVYNTTYGGANASHWTLVSSTNEINTWTAVINLNCCPQPYYLIIPGYDLSVVRFFLRRKGDTAWLRLTCIVQDPFDPKYEALKFVFNNGQLQNAC